MLGGSTNAVLHLLAMARAADIELSIDDFQDLADKTPYLGNLKYAPLQLIMNLVVPHCSAMTCRPSGAYHMEDLHKIGGIPSVLKYLIKNTQLVDGSQMTVTGKTLAQNVEDAPDLDFETQDVIMPLEKPVKKTGHLTILKGNLAPGTAVAKITGKEGVKFEGIAKVFDV